MREGPALPCRVRLCTLRDAASSCAPMSQVAACRSRRWAALLQGGSARPCRVLWAHRPGFIPSLLFAGPFRVIQAQTHLRDSQWPQILRGHLRSPPGRKAVCLSGLHFSRSPLPTRRLCQAPLSGSGRSLGQFSHTMAHWGVPGTPVLTPLPGLALAFSLLWQESLFSLAGTACSFQRML